MKRYKLLTQDGYDRFKEGEIYEEDFTLAFTTVKEFSEKYPSDWELVVEETDEEVVNKLVSVYWFDPQVAKDLLKEFKNLREINTSGITIYEVAKLIEYFK